MKEQRTIASRRLSIGAVLVTVLLAVSADVASAASSSPPRTAVSVYAPHAGSPDARPAFVPFAANTPHLGTRDRLLFQGLGALSLTLTLALALQSRVLDAKDEGSVPRWVHRCVPVVDVVVTAALATIGVAIVYASLWALSHDAPLGDRDRTFLKWLETLVGVLAFWVILVGVSRRALPVLWRRHRSRPWHLEFDWFVAAGAFFGSLLGVSVGYALIYPDPFDPWLPAGIALALLAFGIGIPGCSVGLKRQSSRPYC